MTLVDLLPTVAGMTDADAKALALVFGDDAHSALLAAQAQRPDARDRVAPVQLTDGRWLVCADVLREAAMGGMYAEGFALLPSELFDTVDVMPWDDAVALLPAPVAPGQLSE
jgi:hypothetical protein